MPTDYDRELALRLADAIDLDTADDDTVVKASRHLRAAVAEIDRLTNPAPLTFSIGMPLAEIEMRVIHETLRHTGGDKQLTAKMLGIATRTVYRRLEATRSDDSGPTGNEGQPC
jgi:DNA-binding NtrC family response regulator